MDQAAWVGVTEAARWLCSFSVHFLVEVSDSDAEVKTVSLTVISLKRLNLFV